MSLIRSPPGISGHGGSQPDLSKLHSEMALSSQKAFRKRKQPERETELMQEFAEMRTELLSILNKFTQTQNETLNGISKNISDIREEIKSLQSTTQTLILDQNYIKEQLNDFKKFETEANNKFENLESDLKILKASPNKQKGQPTLNMCENIVNELQDRYQREKNIVIVGVPEPKGENQKERSTADTREIIKIIKSTFDKCPEPLKIFRLGKYMNEKCRPIKVIFSTQETAKTILRNRSNLKENSVKIYSDQTPYQQKVIKILKEELQRRSQNGEENLTIKYINGTPKIIQKPSKNSSPQ